MLRIHIMAPSEMEVLLVSDDDLYFFFLSFFFLDLDLEDLD